jgi:ATP-grasp domain-containing protein
MSPASLSPASQHVLVINRFDNESGRYHRYIDHEQHRVAYITTSAGLSPLPCDRAETVIVVDDLTDRDEVRTKACQVVDRFGPLDHVLALSEFDLELGAEIRDSLGVPGPQPDDIRRVRDKVTMKRLVAAAGLPVPRFATVDSIDAVRRFAATTGFPLVLKPRRGWDSQGVFLVGSAGALDQLLTTVSLQEYECEEFIEGRMYQVDGVVQHGRVRLLRASRLLNSCLEFALGGPFGSVVNDDVQLERRINDYTQRVVDALRLDTSAFHLELFHTDRDELVFLEIGARVGGAQIPYLWRDVYGVDLHETWVRMLLGESVELPDVDVDTEAGGYLLMPEPPARPCRVLGATSLVDRVPEMYAEVLPAPGTVLDGTGGCRETGGRYRFRGPTSEEVEQAILRTVTEHRLDWEPVTGVERETPRVHGRSQSKALP